MFGGFPELGEMVHLGLERQPGARGSFAGNAKGSLAKVPHSLGCLWKDLLEVMACHPPWCVMPCRRRESFSEERFGAVRGAVGQGHARPSAQERKEART